MAEKQSAEEDLLEIRKMMERSSKFLSLSGMAGIGAGLTALAGAGAAYWKLHSPAPADTENEGRVLFLAIDALLVLLLALAAAIFFTSRVAKRRDLPLWNHGSRLLVTSLAIPLLVGFLLCIIFLLQSHYGLLAAVMLIFYGMALLHASKYTLEEIRFLAWGEMAIGLSAACLPEFSLLFLAIGFGLFHIVYGSFMYFRYERW